VKIGNEANVTISFCCPDIHPQMNRITSEFLEVCIKYLRKRSRAPQDMTVLN